MIWGGRERCDELLETIEYNVEYICILTTVSSPVDILLQGNASLIVIAI